MGGWHRGPDGGVAGLGRGQRAPAPSLVSVPGRGSDGQTPAEAQAAREDPTSPRPGPFLPPPPPSQPLISSNPEARGARPIRGAEPELRARVRPGPLTSTSGLTVPGRGPFALGADSLPRVLAARRRDRQSPCSFPGVLVATSDPYSSFSWPKTLGMSTSPSAWSVFTQVLRGRDPAPSCSPDLQETLQPRVAAVAVIILDRSMLGDSPGARRLGLETIPQRERAWDTTPSKRAGLEKDKHPVNLVCNGPRVPLARAGAGPVTLGTHK